MHEGMQHEGPGFAIFDEDGVAFYIAETYDEALAVASEAIPDADVWYEGPPPWEGEADEPEPMAVAANAKTHLRLIRGQTEPEWAFDLLGLTPMTSAQIDSMSLRDAHQTIQPFFPTFRTGEKSREVGAANTYKNANDMAKAFLAENHKLTKPPREGLPMSRTIGLNLMPARTWARTDIQKVVRVLTSEYGVRNVKFPRDPKATFCAGATEQCKASCLVFSGKHGADRYNVVKKLSLTMALYNEPVAFMRVLYEAIRNWERECSCTGAAPFVRLNMLSDIPWELLVPDMFDTFRGITFYDYTKVAGRMPLKNGAYPIPNYDLTFSYAGTKHNLLGMDHEIKKNHRRVAVTFALIGKSSSVLKRRLVPVRPPSPGKSKTSPKWPHSAAAAEERGAPWVGLPKTFMDLPVIDGDQSDFRPYDPPKCVVGLRWKTPLGQKITAAKARLFIVPGYLVREAGAAKATSFVIMELPRYTRIFRKEKRLPWEGLSYDDEPNEDEIEIEEAD